MDSYIKYDANDFTEQPDSNAEHRIFSVSVVLYWYSSDTMADYDIHYDRYRSSSDDA